MMHLVMRMDKAITVRVPEVVYDSLKESADKRGVSLNTVVSEAIAQYNVRVQRSQAISSIEKRLAAQEQTETARAARDSMEDLRNLRNSSEPGGTP